MSNEKKNETRSEPLGLFIVMLIFVLGIWGCYWLAVEKVIRPDESLVDAKEKMAEAEIERATQKAQAVEKAQAARGQFGDMFGGINALFSALAFAVLIYTMWLQRKELRFQRQELKANRREMKLARAEAKRQADTATRTALIGGLAALWEHHNSAEQAATHQNDKETQQAVKQELSCALHLLIREIAGQNAIIFRAEADIRHEVGELAQCVEDAISELRAQPPHAEFGSDAASKTYRRVIPAVSSLRLHFDPGSPASNAQHELQSAANRFKPRFPISFSGGAITRETREARKKQEEEEIKWLTEVQELLRTLHRASFRVVASSSSSGKSADTIDNQSR